jgi:DNA-binding GntR family transcriptional regulator
MTQDDPSDGVLDWTPNPSAHTLSLPEQIAERIGNDIIRGRHGPGARIQEQEVAARFNVSRGPVREALRILERDGLIQINARRGAQVTELTEAQLNEIFDPRITLNGLAARRAAERRDPELLARLKIAIDRLTAVATADTDSYVNAVYLAHRTICEASGNPFLTRLVFLLAHQTLRYTRLGLSTPKRRLQSARNWRRLLAAVQSGEADEAQEAAEQLARDSRDTAVRLLGQEIRDGAARPAATGPAAAAPAAPAGTGAKPRAARSTRAVAETSAATGPAPLRRAAQPRRATNRS